MDVLSRLPAPVRAASATRHHPIPKPRDPARHAVTVLTVTITALTAALTATVGAFL